MSLKEYAQKRFLIVDELDSFRFATKKTLLELDLKLVDTAGTAQQVLSGFQNVNYDVTLCNYDLGKGKNGQELLEELRFKKLLKYSDLFFIISAEVDKSKVMGTIENEPDGYLVKPVTPKELQQRLSKALKVKAAMKDINTAIDEGDFHSAIAYCDKKIADKDKLTVRCLKIKAWLLSRLGDVDEARQIYESVLGSGEHIWAEYGLAKIMIRRKQFDQAEKILKKIIARDGDQIEALDLLAKVYERQERSDEAQTTVENALSLSPNSVRRQQHKANLCIQNEDNDAALESYRAMHKLSEQSVYAKPEQIFDFANFLGSLSEDEHQSDTTSAANSAKFKEAQDILEKSKKRFEGHVDIQDKADLVNANIHAIIGDTDKATEQLEAILAKHQPDSENATRLNASTLKLAAQTLSSLGREEEAEKLLEHAADIAKEDAELLEGIYDQLNQGIGTETRKRAALINKQGIKLYGEKKVKEAASELKKALPLTPRHISLNLNLAQVLIKLYRRTKDESLIKDIHQHFHRVRHIPRHHKEFKRYQYLVERLETQKLLNQEP